MSDISVEEVKSAARNVIRRAAEDDTLHEVTLRIARRKVEEQLGLEEGILDTRELKDAVKDAVEKAVHDTEAAASSKEHNVGMEEPHQLKTAEGTSTTSKKRNSDVAASETRKKPRAEQAGKSEKAAKTQPKPTSTGKGKPKDTTKKTKGQRVVRSASVVPSSDEEDEGGEPKSKLPNGASSSELSPTQAETSKERPVLDDDEPEASRPEPTNQQASESDDQGGAPKPARGRKKKTDETSKKVAPVRKRKAKDTDESPEDAEIKRLKSFVTACGVRKVWSKEFKDIADDKNAQARRLRALLAELGMTGRLSMEKAKAIRAKRELAQELEDVTSFEKAVVTAGSRRKRDQPVEQAGESEDEEDGAVPKKRAPNARMSIMAFLGDQSDED
ncbi:hypothetical protein PsYK624_169030 [Phanerochaete sordida]|uniref:DEK C-terminal domain-containing protein n=1 Tax=Phanerochaete sordida TaxID=48140 RepID=A0A9P3GY43_9APHY|nr:hypothetical protein PsYK624_169030 [Phanerochaete sordida]